MASPELHVVQGKEENRMEGRRRNSQLWDRFEQYCREKATLERKLQNGCLPSEKSGRLQYRLNDLSSRLIPQLVLSMQD